MPQKENSIIRSLMDPTIALDSLEMYDLDTGTSDASRELKLENQVKDQQMHKDLGTNYPFIEINNYVFNQNEIEKFEINYEGFLPIVSLTAGVKSKNFGSAATPKDGDIMSVFIRTKNDAFKPIRNDYRITSVSSRGANNEGKNAIYDIGGELFVPHLYDEVIRSHTGTSYEVLKTLAKELKLGFASNDTATNDSQTWVNPNGDYFNYILDISEHSWKDEKSFFNCFIDIYYNLNFVNINNQFSEDNNLDLQLLMDLRLTDSVGGQAAEEKVKNSTGQVPKILSNYQELLGTPAFVQRFNVQNFSNQINATYGYKTYKTFFEQNSEKYWSIYTEPLTTEGAADNKIILKGRATKPGAPKDDYWKTQFRYEWGGIQYTAPEGNCHEKYTYARTWNERNLAELQKMTMTVELERGNFNIYRCERIPLFLIIATDIQFQNIMSPPEQPQNSPGYPQPILDKFNSGYYMVSGMVFEYSPASNVSSDNVFTGTGGGEGAKTNPSPGFKQKMTLTRREWPTPV